MPRDGDSSCLSTPLAYQPGLEFRRLRLFEKSCAGWFTERDVFELDLVLLADPESGDLIPGAKGLRKLRRPLGRWGKRGGARIIYFHAITHRQILLLYAYAKSRQGDLTSAQTRQLAMLVQEEFP